LQERKFISIFHFPFPFAVHFEEQHYGNARNDCLKR